MRATRLAWAGGSAIVFLAACVSNPAPDGWLPPADVTATEAWGGWIVVDTATGARSDPQELSGELIAVDRDSVFVMSDSTLVAVRRSRARQGTLFAYDAKWNRLAGWGVAGTFGALSNGWFFGLTGPIWIISSTVASANQSKAPRVEASDSSGWDGMRLYARFPQGLPPGLDRRALRPVDRSRAVTPGAAGP